MGPVRLATTTGTITKKEDKKMENNEIPVMFGTGAPEPLNTRQEVLDRLCDTWQDIQNAVDNDEGGELDLDEVMQNVTRVADFLQKEWGIDFWAKK